MHSVCTDSFVAQIKIRIKIKPARANSPAGAHLIPFLISRDHCGMYLIVLISRSIKLMYHVTEDGFITFSPKDGTDRCEQSYVTYDQRMRIYGAATTHKARIDFPSSDRGIKYKEIRATHGLTKHHQLQEQTIA